VTQVYLPHYGLNWKKSTAEDNEGRLRFRLLSVYSNRPVDSFTRAELQNSTERKAASYSYSVVAHIRWSLRQIFRLVVNDGHLSRNPAEELIIPPTAKRPDHQIMSVEEVKQLFEVLAPGND
jgi:site-specific recombinase XerD